MKKVIAIDMDNTLCDFTTPYLEGQYKGLKYPQSEYGFFVGLEPLDGAIPLVKSLGLHFEIHIVSRPSVYNPLCYTEKAVWVKNHFGQPMLEYFTLTTHKHKFIADYLIDDMLWPEFTGEQILFGQDPFNTWHDVFIYIMNKEGLIN